MTILWILGFLFVELTRRLRILDLNQQSCFKRTYYESFDIVRLLQALDE